MSILQDQYLELKAIDKYRKLWLLLSSMVVSVILFVIFSWNDENSQGLIWVFSTLGILLSVVWWYWTMRMIRVLVIHRLTELQILKDLYHDIKILKSEIQKKLPKV
jgi:cell shape-determining protein MreC